jgi:DNA-binding PadR family transcriptional regulator
MDFSQVQILKFIQDEGVVSMYPFVEMGALPIVVRLVDNGLVERIEVKGDLDRYRITEVGRRELSEQRAAVEVPIDE